VPSHVIDKAIQKAAGGGGDDLQPARYEGFGPDGALVIIDCLTDNNQRTITDVRNCFTKTGPNWARTDPWRCRSIHLAIFSFKGDSDEKVLEALFAADVAVEEVESKEGSITVFAHQPSSTKPKRHCSRHCLALELEVQEIISFRRQQRTQRGRTGLVREISGHSAERLR